MGIRRIVFRGYNLKNKKWLYGYYLVNRGKHFIAEEGLQPPGMTWEDFEVDPESVGQCTDFEDKNGVVIYEGDIMKTGAWINKVVWENGHYRFHPYKSLFFTARLLKKCLVVGNEYECKKHKIDCNFSGSDKVFLKEEFFFKE
jgi:hypothetical protein